MALAAPLSVTEKVLVLAASEPPRPPDPYAGDRELVERCLAGTEQAHREFVDRFAPLVFSACVRGGLAPEDAEDVSQDVFVDAFRGLSRYRGQSRLSTWIFSVASRRIADFFRSPRRRERPSGSPGDETFPDPGPSPRPGPEEDVVRRSEEDRLRSALERLGDPARAILIAYYLGETPVAQIARAMRIPEGTVKTHLRRGRFALRKELENPC